MKKDELLNSFPILEEVSKYQNIFWINPNRNKYEPLPFNKSDIDDAEERLKRFAPLIEKVFPETMPSKGLIESPLLVIENEKEALQKTTGSINGDLLIKCDSHLPVSGSVKARGGIYEVLKFAEGIALDNGLLSMDEDYSVLLSPSFKQLFSRYSVAVGSTGNLGLSIGIISSALGFQATVHMSSDARQWKKDLLRSRGVAVIEYPDDYQEAVAQGRKEAASDPMCHFVDDEGSEDLFLGYSVAAKRLSTQLKQMNISVDEMHPLFVYIPCGVGGAPGGITFGLKEYFGENVHVFFAEPTHAPCMTLGLITGLYDKISCKDLGLDGKTEADGLAVGRPSCLVSGIMRSLLDGCFTVSDEELYPYLKTLADTEKIYIEPSACASFSGPSLITKHINSLLKIDAEKIRPTHILWATGGNMVPAAEMSLYYNKGVSNEQQN